MYAAHLLDSHRLGLWTYDVEQRLERYWGGPNGSTGRSVQYYDYDPVSRLSEIEHNIPTIADRVTIGLSGYNPAGQIATRTRTNAAYAFDDTALGPTSYTRNGLNQYDPIIADGATIDLTYDARGNLTGYNPPATADDRVYAYDALNRTISSTVGGAAATYGYDPLGRLYSVNPTGTANDRRYLWDGDRIIGEYSGLSGTGTVRRRFVHAPGSLGAPVTQYEGPNVNLASRRYLQTDERGSVISMVNASTGATTAINTYGPYGENGPGNGGQFQYAGQLWLPEAELFYMRARMYEPALGRFLQTDPIGFAGGMNLYGYVGNDAINFIDPLGLDTCPDGVGICVTGFRPSSGGLGSLGGSISTASPSGDPPLPPRIRELMEDEEEEEQQCPTPPASRPVGGVGTLIAGTLAAAQSGVGFGLDIFEAEAEAFSESRYPSLPTSGNIRDASRHFRLSFSLGRMAGPARATLVLNSIEVLGGNPQTEQRMDTYNNFVGVSMSQDPRFHGGSAAEAFDAALAAGCLIMSVE